MKRLFLLLLPTLAAMAVACAAFLAVPRAEAQVAASYFAIDNSGAITVTAEGATAINALTADVTYTLTVAATNVGGTGTGTVTINVHVPPPSPPVVNPVTFDLATPVTGGQAVGSVTASGNPTSWAITGSSP